MLLKKRQQPKEQGGFPLAGPSCAICRAVLVTLELQCFGAKADRSLLSKTRAQSCSMGGVAWKMLSVLCVCPNRHISGQTPARVGDVGRNFFSCFFQIFVTPEWLPSKAHSLLENDGLLQHGKEPPALPAQVSRHRRSFAEEMCQRKRGCCRDTAGMQHWEARHGLPGSGMLCWEARHGLPGERGDSRQGHDASCARWLVAACENNSFLPSLLENGSRLEVSGWRSPWFSVWWKQDQS